MAKKTVKSQPKSLKVLKKGYVINGQKYQAGDPMTPEMETYIKKTGFDPSKCLK